MQIYICSPSKREILQDYPAHRPRHTRTHTNTQYSPTWPLPIKKSPPLSHVLVCLPQTPNIPSFLNQLDDKQWPRNCFFCQCFVISLVGSDKARPYKACPSPKGYGWHWGAGAGTGPIKTCARGPGSWHHTERNILQCPGISLYISATQDQLVPWLGPATRQYMGETASSNINDWQMTAETAKCKALL